MNNSGSLEAFSVQQHGERAKSTGAKQKSKAAVAKADSKIVPADVLKPGKAYEAWELGQLLGVSFDELARADAAGKFRGYRGSRRVYQTEDVLALCEAGELSVNVTEEAIALINSRRQPCADVEPKTPSILDLATDMFQKNETARLARQQADEQGAWEFYVKRLLRADGPAVSDSDAADLAAIMRDLDLSHDARRRRLEQGQEGEGIERAAPPEG